MERMKWSGVLLLLATAPSYAVSQITRDLVANSAPIPGAAPWLLLGAITAGPFLVAWVLLLIFDRRKASGRK